jgi:hypothetical protein
MNLIRKKIMAYSRGNLFTWAKDALLSDKVDPDLDPTHPSGEGGVGKYDEGWTANAAGQPIPPIRQPHQWANFILNQITLKMEQLAQYWNLWDVGVDYELGAVVQSELDGKMYVAGAPTVGGTDPSTNVIFLEAITNESWSAFRFGPWAAHKIDLDNPHVVTATQADTYDKQELDILVGGIQDDADLHADDETNPHDVTAAQVGCLDLSIGGTFTGDVSMGSALRVSGSKVQLEQSNSLHLEPTIMMKATTGHKLGVTEDGDPVFTIATNGTVSILIHEGNVLEAQKISNLSFTLPEPWLDIPLQTGIDGIGTGDFMLTFSRNTTLPYVDREGVVQVAAIDEPAVDYEGLVLTANTIMDIVATYENCTVVVWTPNGVVYSITDEALSDSTISNYFVGLTHVSRIAVYPTLTDFQKSSL